MRLEVLRSYRGELIMKSRLLGAFGACVFTVTSIGTVQAVPVIGQGTWESTLESRDLDGDAATFEAYYDTTLDITWLADANAADTSMNWANAKAWAAGLDINGITGWRLPLLSPINGSSFNLTFSTDGTTDYGTATTTTNGTDGGWRDGSGNPVSEMGHMFYVTLANLGACDPTLPWCTLQSGSGLSNTGPFSNMAQPRLHWSGTELPVWGGGYGFSFVNGWQLGEDDRDLQYAWAVHSGDVGAVPVPAAVWLFGSGLIGLVGVAKRKKVA